VGSGPGGHALEFTHSTRLNKQTLDELHGVLSQACQLVPHGLVCFFTSYAYMDSVLAAWRQSGQLAQINRSKPVMTESRSATESEAVWTAYCAAAATPRGAMLLCVMGGKLSEGINFSDHLARCVVVVGMPYPDLRDPILQEKLKHSDSLEANSGKQLYEAMCMKSVNQSIGRSIRHVHDYAAILLIDRRYSQPRVVAQLPSWIERSVKVCPIWSEARSALESFFASRRR
jgi:chromosome transmission fidelity protein 1